MRLNVFGFCTVLKEKNFRKLSALILLFVCVASVSFSQDILSKAENLWSKTNLAAIEQRVALELNLSQNDSILFFDTLIKSKFVDIRSEFYNAYIDNKINDVFLKEREEFLIGVYKREYSLFVKTKKEFLKAINLSNTPNLRQEAVNGPCTNMDFTQNFTGWTGAFRHRDIANNNNNPVTGPWVPGFLEHCIMTPAMTDPYIPVLSVVPPLPAPQRALRLGNVINGGQMATITQTFLVTQANTILTYRYAVVLEDPKDAANHDGLDAPHFAAILTAPNGDTLRCAKYSVIVKDTGIVNGGFTLGCNTTNGNGANNNNYVNWGCPNGAVGYDGTGLLANAAKITTPNSGTCGNNRSFYYKNWTTISIPLTKYVGQNMTMTFTASDCTPGGHLGYAYVQAECSPITVNDPGYICSGKQTKILKAPPGFASYKWSGPGIVGSTTGTSITVNKSGKYQMVLIPFSDEPCPDTAYVYVREHCAPPAISKTYCEDSAKIGKVAKVNLSNFESEIKGTYSNATAVSWHKALPATAANKLAITSGQVVTNGMSFYAIIKHPMPVGDSVPVPQDTVALSFVVNKKPIITFPAIPNTCVNSPSFSITGLSPAGGSFSGSHVTATGVFSPVEVGSFPIQYKVTNVLGCSDSLSKKAVVINLPSIQAFGDTVICYKNAAVSLPIKATMVGDSINWTSTFGTIANKAANSTKLAISGNAPLNKTITIVATALVKGCPSATDTIKIITHQLPSVIAPNDTLICTSGGTISLPIKAKALYQDSLSWNSSDATFSNTKISNPIATVSSVFPAKVTSKLVVSVFKQSCPVVKDSFSIILNPIPKVKAPNDSSFCSNITSIPLNGTSFGTDSTNWTVASFAGSFANANALSTSFSRAASTTAVSATFMLTGFSKKCGTNSDNVIIQLEAMPKIVLTKPDSLCKNNPELSTKATISNVLGVAWFGKEGKFSPDSLSANIQYIPNATEILTKKVWLKATTLPKPAQLCPMVSDSMLISIYNPPIIKAPLDTVFCEPKTAIDLTLSAQSFAFDSVVWQSAIGIPSPKKGLNTSINLSTDTPFKVFVTAYKKGCLPVIDSSNVTFEALTVVSATATPTCFADQRVILSGVSTKSGLKNLATWTSDGRGSFAADPDSVSNVYFPSANDISNKSNKLTLTSKGQKYCPTRDTTIVWKYVPFPMAYAGKDDTVCINTTISRTTTSNSDWSYDWKSSESATSISSSSDVFTLITKDTTWVFLTVKNSRNCEAKDSVMILGITPPILSVTPKICFYSPISITTSVTNPPALGKYTWKWGDSVLSETSTTILLNQTGKYTYEYLFKLCSASTEVEALAPPKLIVKDTSACQNQNALIEANSISGASYFWNNSLIGIPANTFTINAGNGIANAKVLVIDANSCRDSSTFNVKIFPYPNFKLKGLDICPNEENVMKASLLDSSLVPTFNPVSTWFKDGLKQTSVSNNSLTYHLPGIYKLEIGIKGCKKDTSIVIANKPSPVIDIPRRYKMCYETDPDLTLTSNIFTRYQWLTETNELIDTTQSIKVKPEQDTQYQLFVTNQYNCKESTKVLVRKVCPPRLFVPNIITPESQDVNAALRIFGAHYTNFEITIFNRWGEIIYNTKDPKNAWDGVYKSENMPIGNYQWQVTYEGDSEEYKGPYKKTGDVAVVR